VIIVTGRLALIITELRFSSAVAKIYTSFTLLGISSQVSQLPEEIRIKT
jgi:hypothetical protein